MASRALARMTALCTLAISGLAVAGLATCYRPAIPDGAFSCGPNGLCPSGFVCRADLLCYRSSSPDDGGLDLSVPDLPEPLDLSDVDSLGGVDSGLCSPRTLSFASSTAVTFPAGSGPVGIVSADLDGDHVLDLVATTYTTNLVQVIHGKGGATFGTPTTYRIGTAAAGDAEGVGVGDFTGDGIPDIVATSPTSLSVSILMATAPGVFTVIPPTFTTPVPPITALVADFNADNKPDVAIGFSNGSFVVATGTGTSNGVNALTGAPIIALPLDTLGDWNHDGKMDVAGADIQTVDMAAGRTVSVELGAGGDTFGAPSSTMVGSGPAAMAAADFNHDGNLDLAVANYTSDNVSILLGKGDGTFTVSATVNAGAGPDGVVAADFNCDGKIDLVVSNNSGATVSVLAGNGNGTFGLPIPFGTGAGPGRATVGDFDGDGWLDVIVANFSGDTLTLLRNQ